MEDSKFSRQYVDSIKHVDAHQHYPPFLDIQRAAEFLGEGKYSVYRLSARGALEKCKCLLGRRVIFLRDCVADLFAEGKLAETGRDRNRCQSRADVRSSLVKYLNRLKKDPSFRQKYKSVIGVNEMTEMLHLKRKTVHEWSSRGLLDSCKRKIGRRLKIILECLLNRIANDGFDTAIRSPSEQLEHEPVEIIEEFV